MSDWEERIAALWATLSTEPPAAFRDQVTALVGELAPDDPRGLFERACAHDSTGQPERAIPLYRAALAAGLTGLRRRRAVIQMASSQRNLGQARDAAEMLKDESTRGDDELSTSVNAFLALALSDLGHDREALSLALQALARHLPRYNASLARYAAGLASRSQSQPDPADT